MQNSHVYQRLIGIQNILKGVHQAGVPMSAATKGQERAAFIDQFLSQVLPLPYRFGTGDATDLAGNRSGQLDVVVEYPFSPTLPLGVGPSRLYLAEGVAAVIEVKSDAAGQWNEALCQEIFSPPAPAGAGSWGGGFQGFAKSDPWLSLAKLLPLLQSGTPND